MNAVGTAAQPSPARGWLFATAAPICLLAVATFWAYAPMLWHGLHSDDFALIETNRDFGFGDLLWYVLSGDSGGRPLLYWRPAWCATFWAVDACWGGNSVAFHTLSLALHLLFVVSLFLVARKVSRSVGASLLSTAVFALHASHSEAVLWVSATTNVVPPAALLLLAATLTWRCVETGRTGNRLGLALAAAAASLLWREAAYSFPLVLAGGWWISKRGRPWGRQDTHFAIALALAALLVLMHYGFRNQVHYGLRTSASGVREAMQDMASLTAFYLAGFVGPLLPLPGSHFVVAGTVLAAAGVALVFATAKARFWLIASLAATFPYVFMSSAGRFAYLFHGPLCVLIACGLAALLRGRRTIVRGAVATALALAVIAIEVPKLRAEVGRWGQEAAAAERCVTALIADGHADGDRLFVDVVPPSLANGLAAAVGLRTGRRLSVHSMQVLPRPPFLIHINHSGLAVGSDESILQLQGDGRYRSAKWRDVTRGLLPVPLFSLCSDYRVVAGESEAAELLRLQQIDPSTQPILYETLPVQLSAAGSGHIQDIRTDVRDMGVTVHCTTPMLLVIAFPVPADFLAAPAAIFVDDQPVKVYAANQMFHAVVVAAGEHRVRLRPNFL